MVTLNEIMSLTTQIQNLKQLLSELENVEDGDYSKIANRLALSKEELRTLAVFSEERYTRVCIARTDNYELLLLGWNAHQATLIHGHDQQACWVHFVEGEFIEELYSFNSDNRQMVKNKTQIVAEGKTTFMEDEMGYHSLINTSDSKALSLHLYVKPIDSCVIFDEDQQAFVASDLEYDKVL